MQLLRITSIEILVVYSILCAVLLGSASITHRLPMPQPLSENPTLFSEKRAKEYLSTIITKTGVRECGTMNNELITPKLIVEFLESLKSMAKSNKWLLEWTIQRATGAISYTFVGIPFTNAYLNISNVIIRLSPIGINLTTSQALLINAHYDSAYTSPGASDDGVGMVTSLEIINNLIHQSSKNYKHPLIILLNGAEETFLQGSHAFMTQHAWAKTVHQFINLEALGSGGKEILFQATRSSHVLSHYCKWAIHPFTTVISQKLFDSNIIPADTDYRIFRDYGVATISGIDVAFIKNGLTYHTSHDDINHLEDGQIQHLGDNVLSIIQHILYESEMSITYEDLVFFDLFGYKMIVLSSRDLLVIWNTILVFCLGILPKPIKTVIQGLKRFVLLHLSVLCIVPITPMIVTYILNSTYAWYSNSMISVIVYTQLPFIITIWATCFIDTIVYPNNTPKERFCSHIYSTILLYSLLGTLLILFDVKMSYLCLFIVIPSILVLVLLQSEFVFKWNLIHSYLGRFLLILTNCLPLFLYFGYVVPLLLQIAIPLTGKISGVSPFLIELGISCITLFYIFPFIIQFTPFISILSTDGKKTKQPIVLYLQCCLVLLSSLLYIFFQQPHHIFSTDAPRKIVMMDAMDYSSSSSHQIFISSTDSALYSYRSINKQTETTNKRYKLTQDDWIALLPINTILNGEAIQLHKPSPMQLSTLTILTDTHCLNCTTESKIAFNRIIRFAVNTTIPATSVIKLSGLHISEMQLQFIRNQSQPIIMQEYKDKTYILRQSGGIESSYNEYTLLTNTNSPISIQLNSAFSEKMLKDYQLQTLISNYTKNLNLPYQYHLIYFYGEKQVIQLNTTQE